MGVPNVILPKKKGKDDMDARQEALVAEREEVRAAATSRRI